MAAMITCSSLTSSKHNIASTDKNLVEGGREKEERKGRMNLRLYQSQMINVPLSIYSSGSQPHCVSVIDFFF